MRLLFLIFILTFSTELLAHGVAFEAGVGAPAATLENANGSNAHYAGQGFNARFVIPYWFRETYTIGNSINYRIVNYENNANSSSQKEFARQSSFGLGIFLCSVLEAICRLRLQFLKSRSLINWNYKYPR